MDKQQTCLEGVRVLEMARVLAAPLAGQTLGDLGAEVIKVERPRVGDDNRWSGTRVAGDNDIAPYSSGWVSANRNKKSITADFAKPEGRELILALAEKSDIFIENFLPGTLARYGLGYEQMAARNPRIIYCSLTGFGQTGPQANQPGYDAVFQATSGMMDLSGLPDGSPGGGPLKVGFQIADFASGMYLATAALAALIECRRSGRGQHIDVALSDVAMSSMAMKAQEYLVTKKTWPRLGNLHLTNKWMSNVFPCSDAPVMITLNTDEQFRKFCVTFKRPEIAEDPRFLTSPERQKHIEPLLELMNGITAQYQARTLLDICRKAQIPAAPVNNLEQAFNEPQLKHRGTAVKMTSPFNTEFEVIANPIKLSRTPVRYEAPPLLGRHTAEVLQGLLGMSEAQVAALRAGEVI